MRTTVTIDDDVYESTMALSKASGRSLGSVISQLVRRALRVHGDFATRNGLPVFQVSAAVPLIPSNRARQIESDERE